MKRVYVCLWVCSAMVHDEKGFFKAKQPIYDEEAKKKKTGIPLPLPNLFRTCSK